MKKITTSLLALLFTIITFAQTTETSPAKNLAIVPQYSGMYVFLNCTPVREYEYVATIKKSFFVESMSDFFSKYASHAKSLYPNADAIIFHDVMFGFGKDKFDVIKFK